MESDSLFSHLLAALIYALLGIVIFVAGFFLLDKLTPGSLWKELIEEHNTALAIVVGAMSLGMSIIIAAAIF